MGAEKSKIIAKRLLALWVIAYFLIMVIGSRIFVANEIVETGTSPIDVLSDFHLFSIAIVLLFFFPLLFLIRYFAAKAKEKSISLLTTILLIVCSAWVLINFAIILIALLP